MRSATSPGTATPIVSASAISSAPAAAARRATSATTATGTSPSYGQPKAVEMVAVTEIAVGSGGRRDVGEHGDGSRRG